MWSEVDSSMTLQALLGPRDRDNRFLSRFKKKKKKDYPPGPPPGEGEMHLPSPEAVPSLSGSPVGRGGLPTPSSTAPLLEAAADVVREQGWMQGAALGDEQAGAATGGRVEAAAARRGRKC